MFRATMCPSSGENTVPMRHLVLVTLHRWLTGTQGGRNDKPDTQTSTWQHTALKREKHACLRRYSKLQSQHASADPRLKPLGHWDWKSGNIAVLIFNFGTKWRWEVWIMLQPLYPWGRSPRNPLNNGSGWSQFWSGLVREENDFFIFSRTA